MSHRPDPSGFLAIFRCERYFERYAFELKTCNVRVSPSIEVVEFVGSLMSLALEATAECVAVLSLLH